MTERDLEEIICRYPEMIEDGAVYENRQVTVMKKRLDILLRDKSGRRMLIELKVGEIQRSDMAQLLDYEGHFMERGEKDIRVFLVGTSIPGPVRHACEKHGVEWRELSRQNLLGFLHKKKDNWAIGLVESATESGTVRAEKAPVHQPQTTAPLPPQRRPATASFKGETWNLKYFNQLLALSNRHLDLFRRKPAECLPTVKYLGVNAGVKNTDWNYWKDFVKLAFFDSNKTRNEMRYSQVQQHHHEIEVAFGEPLKWDFVRGRTQQHIISKSRVGSPYAGNESEWPAIQADLVDRMTRLVAAIRPYLPKD